MKLREAVYNKYGGHCAYCGQHIEYKDMQVDHINAKRNGGIDSIENYNPSCRLCNHYKRSSQLESFRTVLLGHIIDRLLYIYIFRVALIYGMIEIRGWDKKFYFEKINNNEQTK